MEETPVMFGW